MPQSELAKKLFEEIEKIPTVDAHEHLPPEEDRLKQKLDVLYLFTHYTKGDQSSAGMLPEIQQEIADTSKPLEPRWRKFKPYWEAIRNTSYSQAVLITARDLFGIDDINDQTYEALSQKIAAANKKGWYREVLKERSNIAVSIQHIHRIDVDRELFVPVMHVNEFVDVHNRAQVQELEKKYNVSIHSLDDLVRIARQGIMEWKRKGAVGLKIGHAYSRILQFDKVAHADAERLFNKIFTHLGEGLSWLEAKPLQDFMIHQMIRAAIDYDLVVAIHTGIQAGNWNIITNANPTHLTNLFQEYREARFDVFHGGYPYTSEAGILAKYFPNVYLNMCWMHIISPMASRTALHEWIETVPGTKIIGFGGDYTIVEKVYAHVKLARQNIAQVLAEKIEAGYLTESQALTLAKRLLHDNPVNLYKLSL